MASEALCDVLFTCLEEVYLAYLTKDILAFEMFLPWAKTIAASGFLHCGFLFLKHYTPPPPLPFFMTCSITSSRLFSYHPDLIVPSSYSPNPALFTSIVLSLSDIVLHIYLSSFSHWNVNSMKVKILH